MRRWCRRPPSGSHGVSGLRLIGMDRDPGAMEIARRRFEQFRDRVVLVRNRYDAITEALHDAGLASTGSVSGALFDLGVSSMQLDRPERGFSYAQDAPSTCGWIPIRPDRRTDSEHLRSTRTDRHPAPFR